MSVLSRLESLSQETLHAAKERAYLKTSVLTMQQRLETAFGDILVEQRPFGSTLRKTNLPRYFCERTDLDYMIVFRSGYAPQTYLDRLLTFGEKYYPRALVSQSAPAVVVQTSRITFELVPAVKAFWTPLKVPGASGKWIGADPDQLHIDLMSRNKECHNKLKPAIRLAKLWNARNGYVLPSFMIEQQAIERLYLGVGNTRDYFYAVMSGLSLPYDAAAWRQEELERARSVINTVQIMEHRGEHSDAEDCIEALFA